MTVSNDAARERKADPPTFLLGREARIEDLVTDLSRDSGTIVRDADTYASLWQRLCRYLDFPIASCKRIDRVFRQ